MTLIEAVLAHPGQRICDYAGDVNATAAAYAAAVLCGALTCEPDDHGDMRYYPSRELLLWRHQRH